MKKVILVFCMIVGPLLSGCATIVKGTDQNVLFDTDPSGATCSISRTGEGVLYPAFTTPISLEISKDKDELIVICNKEGYEEAIVHTDSTFQNWALGNVLIGGIFGIGLDALSGAANEYPSSVTVPLKEK